LDFHSFLTEKKISSELQIWNERSLPDVQWTVCLQIRHRWLSENLWLCNPRTSNWKIQENFDTQ
jgi:hypothetical protein